MNNYLYLILIFIILSCDNKPDSEIIKWRKNKNIWDNSSMINYSFDFSASCYCVDEWVREVNVSVNEEIITDVFFIEDSLKPTILKSNDWYTINTLFEISKASIEDAHQFKIEYDKKYGNPKIISIDWDSLMADDESTFYIKNIKQN